jgi:phosphoserine phosphatase
MSVELSARVNQVDNMMVALSKRVVKMNSALATFEQLNFSINQLATKQAQFASNQILLAEAVTRAEKSTVDLNQRVPEATAKSVSAETDKMMAQVDKLNVALVAQGKQVAVVSGSVKKLATQIKSFDGRMNNIAKLNADVEALITLEREDYLELLQRQVDLQALQVAGQQPEEKIDPSIVVYPFVSR